MEESSEKVDTRLMPRLTRSNWTTEFKDAFKEYALTCGEAGEIVITGQDLQLRIPFRDMPRLGVDDEGHLVELNEQQFADSSRGDKQYENYERRYKDLKEGKKKLISKLLMAMDKDVKDSLTTSEGYREMYDTFDILGIWNLTEQVVMGRGAVSVYSLIVRLLRCNQDGAYTKFEKEFKEMVIDLRAQS